MGKHCCLRACWQKPKPQASLPPHWQDLFKDVYDPEKEKLYERLCDGVYVGGNKNQIYKVDPATGGTYRMLSARAITIVWGDDGRYWLWQPMKGSRFEEVAYLRSVWWLELRGELKGYWWPGKYTVSFRLQLAEKERAYGWSSPVTFKLSVDKGPIQRSHPPLLISLSPMGQPRSPCMDRLSLLRPGSQSIAYLDNTQMENQTRRRKVDHGWMEYDIGEFSVESADAEVKLEFSMMETNGWKGGLYVDGVVIQSSHLVRHV